MSRSINLGGAAAWLALVAVGVPSGTLLAEPLTTTTETPERAETTTAEQASALQQDGRWEEAAEAWRQVAEQTPDSGAAWFNLGYCLHAAGRLDEAIDIHRKAAEFDDYHGIAMYNLGCAYALSGRPDAAIEALTASQEAGFRLRGRVEGDSDLKSLRDDPRLAALIKSEPPQGARGMLQKALAHVRQFMQQQGPKAGKRFAAMFQQMAGHARAGAARLQKRLAGDERYAPIAQRLQSWLGHAQDAHADADADTDAASDSPGAVVTIADARRYQQAGEWDAAVSAYDTLVEQDPDDAASWFGLAYCLHMDGDYQRAIEAHRKAATFESIKGIALYNLACAYALTGQTDEALKALKASGDAGFDLTDPMRSDSDLDNLRDDVRFKEFLVLVENKGEI